jgi:hypothetical protein
VGHRHEKNETGLGRRNSWRVLISAGAGSRIKNLAADVKVTSRSFVVFGVSFPQFKNKSLC